MTIAKELSKFALKTNQFIFKLNNIERQFKLKNERDIKFMNQKQSQTFTISSQMSRLIT